MEARTIAVTKLFLFKQGIMLLYWAFCVGIVLGNRAKLDFRSTNNVFVPNRIFLFDFILFSLCISNPAVVAECSKTPELQIQVFFVCTFHNIFRLDTFCTYSCIGTSGKKNQKPPMRGFFDPKPL